MQARESMSLSTRSSLLLRVSNAAREPDAKESRAAWEEFVRIYAAEVLTWARERGLGEHDAADVCQDVLVRFWKRAAHFEYDPKQRFRGYLRQILTSALSEWSKARLFERPVSGLASQEGTTVLDWLPAREALVERIEQAYDTELLQIAIDEVKPRVKPHTWRAFELVALEAVEPRVVAEQLGLSVDQVYTARLRVQRRLEQTIQRLEGSAEVDR
jgi:RNA polymerase sigma factor (sigma-70 family)